MRRIGRYRSKKQRKILIIGSLSLLLFLCVGYAAFSTNLSITAKGNIKEKTRVIQAWSATDQTDFHTDFYKENIVSVTFLDNNNVPSNATESWNVSEDKENGGVMAWVIPNNNDSSKYDLYIGAKSGVIANEDSSHLFYYFTKLNTINFNNNFNTSRATTMEGMFYACEGLLALDLKSFNTSNVTNMRSMFDRCSNLSDLDVSSFDTSNVTTMIFMFDWVNATELDLSNFNTRNVTDMSWMFQNCFNLTTLKLGENFNTSKVTTMAGMFSRCEKLQSINTTIFDTSNVTNMFQMFYFCESLKKLDLSNFDTSKVTNMASMFDGDKSLTEINLSSFNTSNVTNMNYMFNWVPLSKLNLCSFDTRKVTSMIYMFIETPNLKEIKVGPNWTTENADTTGMFNSSSGVSSVTKGQC